MSDKTKIVLNSDGVKELLKSEEMQGLLMELAKGIHSRCGADYEINGPFIGKNRANVSVGATSKKAIQDNLDNNTILKAVRG